ncbi:MAG TPA: VOC family protein [Acidimicrobiales bacterium]|nr:VOC family protein [Acidimicrobiales bacterium]
MPADDPGQYLIAQLGGRDVAAVGSVTDGSAGFSDAIGWMMPMSAHQHPDDIPAHWSVTFSVADTDAIAARVAELGGQVVTPPFDVGMVRVAVISDPQGAVFTVSRFAPG